ncbi:MAG: AAA family ATPase [Acidobacteriota bacterium]|nr:AAA family ATPase [Acidobacteriota bacterium]
MKRLVSERLDAWLSAPDRRPIVLRGARQVGKTWLVRDLARRAGRELVEVNLERDPTFRRYFTSNDPPTILGELSLALGRSITSGSSILFLDEIQAAGELLGKLRWFYEEMPELPVLAAGSLLEFTLRDHDFSVPAGRVSFLQIEPMGYLEYLQAHGQGALAGALASWRPGQDLPMAAHDVATRWFQRYAMVGGMPAAVAADVAGTEPRTIRDLQRDLVATYRADFAKYSGRMDRDILDAVLAAVARSLGSKLVYARVGAGVKQHQARRALELLASARLCHVVRHTAANGLPLGSEAKDNPRKAVLADVGLFHALAGTPAADRFPRLESLTAGLRGQLTDQLAGQQLRLIDSGTGDGPELFFWKREGGRPGEVDYVAQIEGRVVPVELKAGAAGSMKSLHQFMFDKHLVLAVRSDTNPPSMQDIQMRTTRGDDVRYRLIGVPLYLFWNLPVVVADTLSRS